MFGWNPIFPVQNADGAAAAIHLAVIKYFYFLSNLIGAFASVRKVSLNWLNSDSFYFFLCQIIFFLKDSLQLVIIVYFTNTHTVGGRKLVSL